MEQPGAPATPPPLLPGDNSVLGACRASVATLRRLLDLIFPEDTPLDILRVEDVLKRYPFTGLGAPATAAIEQSRRIIRSRRDFTEMGLAEFHAGLIYLYWGDCYAAAQQFAAARVQWSLAGYTPPACLSHYAQGVALQHGYHLEAAMNQFGWTQRCLSRKLVGPQATQLALLMDELNALLAEGQAAIRPELWPREAPRAVAASPGAAGPGAAGSGHGGDRPDGPPPRPNDNPSSSSSQRASAPDRAAAAPPANRQAASPAPSVGPESKAVERPGYGPSVPLPISNLLREPPTYTAGPIPGHELRDDRHHWFVVHKRRDTLLPEMTEGTWVLVDKQAKLAEDPVRELIVFGAPLGGIGSVVVKPRVALPSALHYYLAFALPAPPGGSGLITERLLVVDDSGRAVRVPDAVLLGLVLGFWHNVIA
jgi:hypothetical protein